jgi:stalled ribosome rescue protein Dom34
MTKGELSIRQMAIWIDHDQARVFHVTAESFDEHTVPSSAHHVHRHPKDQETRVRNHPQDELRFFAEVVSALKDAEEILVMGPSVTKLRFLRYAQRDAPGLASRVVGLETADHPTDRQLVAHVRHYFHTDSPRLGVAP